MESGPSFDLLWLFGQEDALLGDFCVEVRDGCDALVDDWLVDERPEGFGGLQFWAVGRQINEADAIGDLQARGDLPTPSHSNAH
jgi:hypothetical protein